MSLPLRLAATLLCLIVAPPALAASPQANPPRTDTLRTDARIAPTLGDDGLYHQVWFLNSFLDMADDLNESTAEGKRFAVLFEQKGCPYCRDLHTVNLADPQVNAYIRQRFNIVQINLWGDREMTDFDGTVLSEKDFARKYNINFTPTILFFPEDPAEIEGKSGPQAELARMPGYFRPFHFLAMFEWVHEKRYAQGQGFQRYILEKAAAQESTD